MKNWNIFGAPPPAPTQSPEQLAESVRRTAKEALAISQEAEAQRVAIANSPQSAIAVEDEPNQSVRDGSYLQSVAAAMRQLQIEASNQSSLYPDGIRRIEDRSLRAVREKSLGRVVAENIVNGAKTVAANLSKFSPAAVAFEHIDAPKSIPTEIVASSMEGVANISSAASDGLTNVAQAVRSGRRR